MSLFAAVAEVLQLHSPRVDDVYAILFRPETRELGGFVLYVCTWPLATDDVRHKMFGLWGESGSY